LLPSSNYSQKRTPNAASLVKISAADEAMTERRPQWLLAVPSGR